MKERHVEVHVMDSLDLAQSLLHLKLVECLNLWFVPHGDDNRGDAETTGEPGGDRAEGEAIFSESCGRCHD